MAKAVEMSTREVREMLDQLDEGIEHLRVAYDKYFSGVDRVAPNKLHQKTERLLRRCESLRPNATVLRFRIQGLRARFITYAHYWTRVMGQIENGTYRRHIQRAQRRQRTLVEAEHNRETAEPSSDAVPSAMDEVDALLDNAFGAQVGTAKPAPAGKRPPPPPPPPSVPGMDARKVRALYDELVRAKKEAGEDTSGLTYRGLCKQLARDAPELRKRHGEITFEVARDGGKVRLRAKVGG